MSPVPSARRETCAACTRPLNACICQWVTPVRHEVGVLILQHPLEVANPKGTARLLHMSLPHSRLVTGEVFDESLFAGGRQVLLYPDTPQAGLPEVESLSPDAVDTAGLCLVVLDGTWRKSLKMLHLNPALQKMPRLSLEDLPASKYLIRKARKPYQLSTLEATCAALARLEGNAGRFEPLLKAFDEFVAEKMRLRAASLQSDLRSN
ncbi:MAG: tRNA-uridine aminocarboxypropyltransferase [Pseudomonadota bacterium]